MILTFYKVEFSRNFAGFGRFVSQQHQHPYLQQTLLQLMSVYLVGHRDSHYGALSWPASAFNPTGAVKVCCLWRICN